MRYLAVCPSCAKRLPLRWGWTSSSAVRVCPSCHAAVRQVPVWAQVGNVAAGLTLIVMLIAGGLASQRLATRFALPLLIVGSLGLIVTFGLFVALFFVTYPFITPYELVTPNILPLPPLAGGPSASPTSLNPPDLDQASSARSVLIPPQPRWDKVLRFVIVLMALFVIPFQVWQILWASGPSPFAVYGRSLCIVWMLLVVGRWIFWWGNKRQRY